MYFVKVGEIKGTIECICFTVATILEYADDHHANKWLFEIPKVRGKTS